MCDVLVCGQEAAPELYLEAEVQVEIILGPSISSEGVIALLQHYGRRGHSAAGRAVGTGQCCPEIAQRDNMMGLCTS